VPIRTDILINGGGKEKNSPGRKASQHRCGGENLGTGAAVGGGGGGVIRRKKKTSLRKW